MKQISNIAFWSIVFALIMVSSLAGRYVSIPPGSIMDKLIAGMEPSKGFMYFVLFGIFFFLIGSFIRPR